MSRTGFCAVIIAATFAAFVSGIRASLESSVPGRTRTDDKQPRYGISERTPWTSSRVHGTPEPPPAYRTVQVFPKLKFKNPTLIASAPGSDRLFVAEQAAKLYSIPNDPNCEHADLFLDVPNEIRTLKPGRAGTTVGDCYGLAFHPDFEQN